MGALGTLAMGLALGTAATAKKPKLTMATQVHDNQAATQPALPEAPTDPLKTDGSVGNTDNEQMEIERERERQRAALRQQAAQEVFTSGLGAAGLAETSKKTLLGG